MKNFFKFINLWLFQNTLPLLGKIEKTQKLPDSYEKHDKLMQLWSELQLMYKRKGVEWKTFEESAKNMAELNLKLAKQFMPIKTEK